MDTSLASEHISAMATGDSQRSSIVTQSRHFATITATTNATTTTATATKATDSIARPANSMSPTDISSPSILINDKDFRNDNSANDTITTQAKYNDKNNNNNDYNNINNNNDNTNANTNNDDYNDISISTIDSNSSWNVTPWLEQQQAQQAQFNQSFYNPLSSHSTGNTDIATNLSILTQQQQMRQPAYIKQFQQMQMQQPVSQSQQAPSQAKSIDDDLIPTAIVIKNIPFAIKKEQLLDLMSKMNLPLPYAFNYHFDNGVFRGLAFANFNSIEETSIVVSTMNGKEIEGRKLRVEYKKMLPLQERERIEREKKEKKFQLEEQHRNTSSTSLASLYSTASAPQPLTSSLVTPVQSITGANPAGSVISNSSMAPIVNNNEEKVLFFPTDLPIPPNDVDFNNPEVLELYTRLAIAKDNNTDYSIYLSTLSQELKQRVRSICAFLDMEDYNDGYILTIRRRQQSATTPLMNFATPSLIRSHSHNVNSTNNNTRLRQLQQAQQVQQAQQQQSQLQQLQQQLQMQQTQQTQQTQQAQQIQQPFYNSPLGLSSLHHSASTASLNVLRSKPTLSVSGLTAPTTPTVGHGRPGTFPAPFLQSQGQSAPHHFQQQLTGGSSISMNELYTGMEYLNFDPTNL
ncbi:hypothetical protein CANINC_000678 [Pichia inconspicua]|uniref:RRM domain-containing protein n=1 Tax=Pichia inconspicua TaxID=52247 RepID=A0A4T0X6W7_9ASCO|nr:hypothetical protein CANINC_000678 [[Candida] inconspicua]